MYIHRPCEWHVLDYQLLIFWRYFVFITRLMTRAIHEDLLNTSSDHTPPWPSAFENRYIRYIYHSIPLPNTSIPVFPMASERDRSNALDSSSIVPVWLAMPFCLLGPTAQTRPPCTRGWRKKEGCGEGVLAADMASSQRRWKSLWLLGSGSCSGLITMFESQQVSQIFADLKSAVIVLRC